MPRLRVVLLDKLGPQAFRFLYWADVPVARRPFYAKPVGTVSVWTGALSTDNDNLISGSVVERVDDVHVPVGTTIAEVQLSLQNGWQDFQDLVTSGNPWVRYGTTWDGTIWVVGGVA